MPIKVNVNCTIYIHSSFNSKLDYYHLYTAFWKLHDHPTLPVLRFVESWQCSTVFIEGKVENYDPSGEGRKSYKPFQRR